MFARSNCECFLLLVTAVVKHVSAKMEPYIIDGNDVSIRNFPHTIYLSADCGNSGGWVCGGSILNQNIVLTAAHCLEDCIDRWKIEAYAGHEEIEKMRAVRTIHRYVIHKNYDEQIVKNDIALAFTKNMLPLGEYIKRIIVSKTYPRTKHAKVAGWGIINDITEESPVSLKMAKQQIEPKSSCLKSGAKEGTLCTRPAHSGRASKGDSGSALITDNYVQIGIVSYLSPQRPNIVVYTNVTYFYEWIKVYRKMLCHGTR